MKEISRLIKGKKKISLDINEEFLNVMDEIANLTKNSRTAIIEAVISRGIFSYLNLLENLWKDYLKEEKYKKIKKDIKKSINCLNNIKTKHEWLNPDYYWENLLSNKSSDEETKKRMIKLLYHMNLMPTDKRKFQKLLGKDL